MPTVHVKTEAHQQSQQPAYFFCLLGYGQQGRRNGPLTCSLVDGGTYSSPESAQFLKEHLRHKVDGLRLQQISKRTPRGPRILGPHPHGETADIVPIPAAPVPVQTSSRNGTIFFAS